MLRKCGAICCQSAHSHQKRRAPLQPVHKHHLAGHLYAHGVRCVLTNHCAGGKIARRTNAYVIRWQLKVAPVNLPQLKEGPPSCQLHAQVDQRPPVRCLMLLFVIALGTVSDAEILFQDIRCSNMVRGQQAIISGSFDTKP